MEFYEFFSFLVILKESIKLLSKNGKLFSLIFILSLVLNSILFLSFNFSFKSLTNDMAVTLMNSFMPDPSSFSLDQSPFIPNNTSFMPDPSQLLAQGEHLRKDFSLLLAVQMAFFIALFVISILSTTATVIVSAMSYNDKTLSLRDLCSRTATTWKRALVTAFYTRLHQIGYWFLVVALAAPLLMSANKATMSAAILLGIFACVYYLYLAVIWIFAVVVSIVQESFGMKALGKATAIIKGRRLHGFMLMVCFNFLVFTVIQVWWMILGNKGLENLTIYGLIIMIVSSLGNFFSNLTYTVLYFQCKKNHGEEIELYGSIEYAKLPTIQPVNE